MGESIGERFQQETKYRREDLDRPARPSAAFAPPPDTGRMTVPLPAPAMAGGAPLWEAVRKRRSVREFRRVPVPAAVLSQLLWASQGVTGRSQGFELRATPSAGALYPVETYVVAQNVKGIGPGVYRYVASAHALEAVRTGRLERDAAEAALAQHFLESAAVVFIWTAVFRRSARKYRQRAYRYVYLDAGHIAGHVSLAAVSLGLGSCQIAAFLDDEVNALVGADGVEESALYMTAVGRPEVGAVDEGEAA